jgi:hypothetical protein
MGRWRPLASYAPFARVLVAYMWEARPPLNPNQLAQRAGIRRQLLSSCLNSRADARIAPEPTVVRRLARVLGRPTSELLSLAGHGDAEDPFLDRVEAVDFALAELGRLDASGEASLEDLAACRRVLTVLRGGAADVVHVGSAGRIQPVEADSLDTTADAPSGSDQAGTAEAPGIATPRQG